MKGAIVWHSCFPGVLPLGAGRWGHGRWRQDCPRSVGLVINGVGGFRFVVGDPSGGNFISAGRNLEQNLDSGWAVIGLNRSEYSQLFSLPN